jgi:hypothetical protein
VVISRPQRGVAVLPVFILMFISPAIVPVATMPGWLQPVAATSRSASPSRPCAPSSKAGPHTTTTMTGTVLKPGERYLHGVACRLLCGDPPTRVIGAAADALAADRAVPGQLAAPC